MSEIDEELISAYLDQELSIEERRMVDAALARDPKLRQLKEQLELVQDDFELLPFYHPQDIQRVIRDATSQIPTLPAGSSVAQTKSSTSQRRRWLVAGISLAACLMVTVTLLVETGNRQEQISMTDNATILPDDMNSQLDQQPRNADESAMSFAAEGEIADMGGAMGGMGGGFAPESASEDQGAVPRAAFSQASDAASDSADPQVGVARSQNLNSEEAPAARGNAAIQSRIQADQTIRLSVTRNQLLRLLETIGSPRPKLAAEKSEETANTPQQRKSLNNSNLTEPSPNELKQTIQPSPLKVKDQQDKRSAPLPYAVQRTPAELAELMTWLRSSKYWPNRQESEELDYESAKDHYTELLEKSSRKKLKVLFLITIEPDHQLKEQ